MVPASAQGADATKPPPTELSLAVPQMPPTRPPATPRVDYCNDPTAVAAVGDAGARFAAEDAVAETLRSINARQTVSAVQALAEIRRVLGDQPALAVDTTQLFRTLNDALGDLPRRDQFVGNITVGELW